MKLWTQMNHQRQVFPVLVFLLALWACQDVPPNTAPEISEIVSYPAQPKTGQEITFSAIVSDDEGDVIRYHWMANGGTFLDTLGSNPIRWTAPSDTGLITITVQASDIEATVTHSAQFILEYGIGSVAGHVKDGSSDQFLGGIVVDLDGSEYTTGVDGYFFFDEVQAGSNIPISATGENYVTYASLIDVNVEENIVNISMDLLTEVGRIAGYVSDEVTGLRLSGALVQSGSIQATTGEDGYYELYNVPISVNVPVRASLEGYIINSSLINVVAGYNPHDIALSPSQASITGRVSATSDGSLLEGAVVTLNAYSDTTNAAGYFELLDVPLLSNASISASLEGYYSTYQVIDIVGGSNYVELELGLNSGSLSGWVRSDLDGAVIPDAIIQVGSDQVLSSSSGAYLLEELGIGNQLVTVSAENYDDFTTTHDIAAGVNALDIDLTPSVGSLGGFLVDGLADSMLSEVEISLGELTTVSAEDGSFIFEAVPKGQHPLEVELDTYQSYSQVVTIMPGHLDHNIALTSSVGSLVGIVRDQESAGVLSGAIVTMGSQTDTSDALGYYELHNLPAGSNSITCQAEYYQDMTDVVDISVGETILDIDLMTSVGDIIGVIRDSETSQGIDGAIVMIGDSSYTTDEDGEFSVLNFPQGSYEVVVSSNGYAQHDEYQNIVSGTNQLIVQLTPSIGSLVGIVRDQESASVLAGAIVTIGSQTDTSDVSGYYELNDLPLGTNELNCQLALYGVHIEVVTISLGATIHDIELISSVGELDGEILDAATGLGIDSAIVVIGDSTFITDENGEFTSESFPQGTHDLLVTAQGYEAYDYYFTVASGMNTISIDLSVTTGQLRGYVRDSATSDLLDSVQVILDMDTTMTDSMGYYEFLEKSVGPTYELQAIQSGYDFHTEWLELSPGDNVRDIDLDPSD